MNQDDRDSNFCAAIGCTHLVAARHTPFCMKHWVKLSRGTQRAVRESADQKTAVELARSELFAR